MMATCMENALWCAVQTALVAAVALATASRWRRCPEAAARVATVAAATILLVSALAWAPLPQWFSLRGDAWVGDLSSDAASKNTTRSGDSAAAGTPAATAAGAEASGVEVTALLRRWSRAASAVDATMRRQAASRWSIGLAALALVGSAAALVGWARAWRHVARLRRESRPASDERLERAAARIAAALNAAGAPTPRFVVRESADVVSPAVLGGSPAVVVLPVGWRDWSAAQLDAALAHELAHVTRGDFSARLLAGAVAALHWYHPLVRWLGSRLAAAQEIAADRLAARATGGVGTYRNALSQLAIWCDEQPRLRAEPAVVPRLSSHLIRRIAMLRSMESNDSQGYGIAPGRRRGGTMAAAAIVAVGLAAAALRGTAADNPILPNPVLPPGQQEREVRVFNREPFDFALIGDNPQGAFVVRVDEIMQQPRLREFVETEMFPQEEWAANWHDQFGADVPCPQIDFSAIEFLAGVGQLKITAFPPAGVAVSSSTDDQRLTHLTAIGLPQVLLRFKRPVDWQGWFKTHFPSLQEKQHGAVAYLELPTISALGPQPLCVAGLDERTIVLAVGEDTLAEALAPRPRPAESELAARWRLMDGGLITFLATDKDINPDPSLPTDQLLKSLCGILGECRGLGFAMDFDPATQQLAMRYEAPTDDLADAKKLHAAITGLLMVAETASVSPETPAEAQLRQEFLSTCQVSFWQTAADEAGVMLDARATLSDAPAGESHGPVAAAQEETGSRR